MTLEEFIKYLISTGWKHNFNACLLTKGEMTISYELDETIYVSCSELAAPLNNVFINENGLLAINNPVVLEKKNKAEKRIRILREMLIDRCQKGIECEDKPLWNPEYLEGENRQVFNAGYKFASLSALKELDKLEDDKTSIMSTDGKSVVLTGGEKK